MVELIELVVGGLLYALVWSLGTSCLIGIFEQRLMTLGQAY